VNQRSKPSSFEMRVVAGLALLLAGSPACSAASASQKVEVFPSLRKHLHMQQQQAEQQKQTPSEDKIDDESIDDVPDAPVEVAPVSSSPLAIPAPMNVGADGFPKLPAVDAMLGGASATMKSISSQASTLQAQIFQVQAANQARMTQQKTIFERKLKNQEGKNQEVVSQNTEVASEIQTLKKGNEDLKKNCHDLQEGNRVMRVELHTLESKFGEAKEFVGASLTTSDDSKAKELAVLKVPVHHHKSFLDRHDDDQEDEVEDKGGKDDDNDDDDSNDDDAESFLAISSQAHRMSAESEDMEESPDDAPSVVAPPSDPSGLVDILKNGVAQMQSEEHASEKKMKAIFVANFQQGQKRHSALMSQQKALNGTRSQLQSLQLNLHGAESHLEGTKTSLQEHLRGLGLFAQRLAHLALAPEGEVSRLLTALPAKVEPAAMPTPAQDTPAGF